MAYWRSLINTSTMRITEGVVMPKGELTGYNDSKGTPIKVGDNGKYYQYFNSEYHVIEREGEFFLEKWCKLSDLPLNKESAKNYTVTGRYHKEDRDVLR